MLALQFHEDFVPEFRRDSSPVDIRGQQSMGELGALDLHAVRLPDAHLHASLGQSENDDRLGLQGRPLEEGSLESLQDLVSIGLRDFESQQSGLDTIAECRRDLLLRRQAAGDHKPQRGLAGGLLQQGRGLCIRVAPPTPSHAHRWRRIVPQRAALVQVQAHGIDLHGPELLADARGDQALALVQLLGEGRAARVVGDGGRTDGRQAAHELPRRPHRQPARRRTE
mmetsp:Transcript_51169/g.164309  ORF Transcript_51169/g.164309 Transcript_51169/m.164309 type:complete len:225 (+) Transcript_51169:257-931(+)